MDMSQYVTKAELRQELRLFGADLERRLERRIVDSLTEVISTAMQSISEAYERHDSRLDKHEAALTRIENKLDATIDKVDDHEVRLRKLTA